MWNRVDLAQRELDSLRKLVGDEDNALVQRASCTPNPGGEFTQLRHLIFFSLCHTRRVR